MTTAEVAEVVGGRLHGLTGTETVTTGVEFDSRAVRPGGLFVALPGERVDGHDYAAAAVSAGAVAVLAARPVDAPAILVGTADVTGEPGAAGPARPDGQAAAVLAALSRLAAAVVRRLPGLEVVGLTGSSGKTSTKDLLAAVLGAVLAPSGPPGAVVAPPGSFNNELGHPWTVLRAGPDTRYLVLELAARGRGHIAALCAVAPPRIGLVLNVGSAHLGEFGSPDAVAEAKGELVESLPPAPDGTTATGGGVAVLNADDPRVAAMSGRTAARVLTYSAAGAEVGSDGRPVGLRATDVRLDGLGRPRFRMHTPRGSADVALRLVGAHQVGNALAVAAAALELGAEPDAVAVALSATAPVSRWRMEVTDRPDGVTVINDAYNANPESMRAGLEALAAITAGQRRGWAVLGGMAELGGAAAEAHAGVGRLAARLGVRHLLAVGPSGRPDVPAVGDPAPGSSGPELCDDPDGAPADHAADYETGYRAGDGEESMLVPDVAAALDVLRARLRPGDVVLVKASRAAGLERVAAGLLAEPAGGAR